MVLPIVLEISKAVLRSEKYASLGPNLLVALKSVFETIDNETADPFIDEFVTEITQSEMTNEQVVKNISLCVVLLMTTRSSKSIVEAYQGWLIKCLNGSSGVSGSVFN
jgi:hypothetical protein